MLHSGANFHVADTVICEDPKPNTRLLGNICSICPLIAVLTTNTLPCHAENYDMVVNSS